jgi:hypothetical protein
LSLEYRGSDFEEEFKISSYLDIFYQLKNFNTFKYASVNEEGTLHWVNLPFKTTFLGKEIETPFDLDPVVLYEKSHSIREYKLVMAEEFA